jgi:DNA polymerase III delta prime subunit
MEYYSKNGLFIISTLNMSDIIEPLKSRLFMIRVKCDLSTRRINNLLNNLLSNEERNNIYEIRLRNIINDSEKDIFTLILKLDNELLKVKILDEGLEDLSLDDLTKTKSIDNLIKEHLDKMRRTKNIWNIMKKNRDLIHNLLERNYIGNNGKSYNKLCEKLYDIINVKIKRLLKESDERNEKNKRLIRLTNKLNEDLINGNRIIYHMEAYLLRIYYLLIKI